MADVKNMLDRYGLTGVNKPKRQTSGGKSHVVLAKEGDQVKLIRFGQAGVKTNQTAGQREAFKSRHAKNIAKGKMSAAYWADKVKWSPSKTASPSKKWVKGS
jgi:hypothetical protein